ncbi:MAG: hypothetical protein IJ171_02515 [Ruminococcus sp.]|nr:hypothetical protein [Ruminococcus sp.]
MLSGCESLTTDPELPATTLADSCYTYMFYGCESLTAAPEQLPATTLANRCYSSMFEGCKSLTAAPELPATTLADSCYYGMFSGCESLSELPELPATTLADSCYYFMFGGCPKIYISDEAGTFDGIAYSAEYRIPSSGTGESAPYALYYMFDGTGGKFKGTPNLNTTYYIPAPAPTGYTVTWKNGDTVLKTDTVEDGTAPAYSGNVPEKAEDDDFTYTFSGWTDGTTTYGATDTLPAVTGDITYTATFDAVAKYEPGYYLVGTFTNWKVDPAYRLTENPEVDGEYMITQVPLTSTDGFKVVYAKPGEGFVWFPDGMDNNISVENNDKYNIYFNPDGVADEAWDYGVIFVERYVPAESTEAINAINALPDADSVNVADAEQIDAARQAYEALTDDQKSYIDAETLQKLTDSEAALAAAIDQDAADAVDDKIDSLPAEITLDDKADVEVARAAFDALTDAQKALIDDETIAKLVAAEQTIADIEAANAVTDLINALPANDEMTIADKDDVEAAYAAYNDLTDDRKALIDDGIYEKLSGALYMMECIVAADEITTRINNLPELEALTLNDRETVDGIREDLDTFDDTALNLVDDEVINKLEAAEAKIADLEAAKAVDDQVNALPETISLDDQEDVEAAREAYEALTDDQKAYVEPETLTKLTAAELEISKLLADKEAADAVSAMINALPVNVTLKDREAVENVRTAYDGLTDGEKFFVPEETLNKLTAAEKRIDDQLAASLAIFKINMLPAEITVDSKPVIEAARAAYDALTDDQKTWVDDVYLTKLTDAEAALAQIEADIAAAKAVTDAINDLPETITLDDKTDVEAAREAYDALTDAQKALVEEETLNKLSDAEYALEVVLDDKAAADDVADLIEALPETITLDDKTDVEAARAAYDALTDAQKAYVDDETLAALTDAEEAITKLTADKATADDVTELINALPTENITVSDAEQINAASDAYDALTDSQKSFVDEETVNALTAAKNALAQAETDKKAADSVAEQISALPETITLDDQADVEAARAAYDALTDAQKAYVDEETVTALTDAEDALAKVLDDKAAADDVTELIDALPEEVTLDDQADIEAARAAYDALTDDQKAYVDDETLAALTDAEEALAAVIADKNAADEVAEQINTLPETITVDDEETIKAARTAYDALTDSQKAFVSEETVQKLTDAEAALTQAYADKDTADKVSELIEALPTENISIDDKDQIKAARAAYDELTDAQKYYVPEETLNKLTDVEEVFAPIEKLYEDQKAALNVEYMIEDLPTEITLDDKDDVEAARAAYDALTDDQKALVQGKFLNMLTAAEDKIAAATVTAQIEALPEEITLDDKTDVEAARAAYDALTDDQKALVDDETLAALTDAEEAIAKLTADNAAADAVTEQIEALPEEITLDDKADVEAARAAYDALTDDQKALIDDDTLAALTDAEDAISKLTADKAAADDVAEQISSLPEEITLDDKTDVEAARAAYDALTDDQKAFVDDETVEKLTDAETAIADLEAAAAVTDTINALPEEITLEDKDDVEAARAAYDALTDDQKALVDEETVTALTDAETAIANLEAAEAVTEQIEALPETITVDDKDDVEAARAAYDALTDDQKALVDDETVNALTEAEDALAAAQVTETINALPTEITDDDINDVIDASIAYEALTDNQKAKIDSETLKKLVSAANAVVKILGDKKEAENVANLINALPEKITSADKEAVEAARAAYDALTDDQKAYVDEDTVKKLTDAEEALNTPVLLGDVDGDGEVTSLDATLIQRQIAFMDVKDFNETAADVDGDGEVTSLDATYIQRYLAFMDVKFPIEQPI